MRLTRRSANPKSWVHALLRFGLCSTVLGAGLWLGTATASSPPAGAVAPCVVSSVDVTVHNETSAALGLDRAKLGLTNSWCRLPGNPIAPGSVTHFEAGDDFFATQVSISYIAPNHDLISLFARGGYDTDEARCIVVANGKLASPYGCTAAWHSEVLLRGALFGLGTHVVLVDWVIRGP